MMGSNGQLETRISVFVCKRAGQRWDEEGARGPSYYNPITEVQEGAVTAYSLHNGPTCSLWLSTGWIVSAMQMDHCTERASLPVTGWRWNSLIWPTIKTVIASCFTLKKDS